MHLNMCVSLKVIASSGIISLFLAWIWDIVVSFQVITIGFHRRIWQQLLQLINITCRASSRVESFDYSLPDSILDSLLGIGK